MPGFKQTLRRYTLPIASLLLGGYCAASALWELGNTALYVHRAIVLPGTVTDVRQRPFESYTEAWVYGNICAAESTAYQPYITFTLPAGITINKAMPDLDCDDYALNQTVDIITHPHDPNQVHVYKAKFLCGWSLMKLGVGTLLILPFIIHGHKRRKHKQSGTKSSPPTSTHHNKPATASREEDNSSLDIPQHSPAKKRRSRKQSSTSNEKTTTARRKKSTQTSTGTSRRRKSPPKE